MKKIVRIYFKYSILFLILLPVVLISCEKTKIQFGQAYVDNSYSNIILVDTITAQLSTVYSDSVSTTGSGVTLAGNYNDNAFGKITAKSFFEIAPPALADLATNAAFDSLKLIIRPNQTYYGDTTFNTQLSVYQLKTDLSFPLYQAQFYNNTDFDVDPNPLGSINTLIYPNNTDTVAIRLSDVTGNNLFDLYKSKDYIMQSATNFLSYFKGLQLAPSTAGMHAIYGFHDSLVMRMYYHETGVFTVNKFLDFPFYNSDNKQFNQVKTDRTGTPLSGFNSTTKEVVSTSLGNSAYIQVLTGFMAKVKFPTIRNLLLRPDFIKILKAELVIRPLKSSYNAVTPLPPDLSAATTDQSNLLGAPLGFTGGGAQTGSLIIDALYNENTSYDYDVTAYLQQQILIGAANQNGLLLIPPFPTAISSFNRVIIGDQKNTQGSIQLKLYYVSVNP
ncbi:MAG: DUF4270 family protein [Ginsengibacter sp.]